MVKQISVFLENKKGRLARMTEVLGQNGVDLIALSIADTTSFGILRAIVNDTDKAVSVLREAGFTVNVTQVLACMVPDRPGGLSLVLGWLKDADISVEYLYSFVHSPGDEALILFRLDDTGRAETVLAAKGARMLSHEQVLSYKR